MIGRSFGRWKVVDVADSDKTNKRRWLCVCECGTTRVVRNAGLLNGSTQSCGCLKIEIFADRSRNRYSSDLPEYKVWRSMVQRCHLPTAKSYKSYGAIGITVCDRWRTGTKSDTAFECFMDDMGARPSQNHSIDRINTNKGYSPNNCRWATKTQQSNNAKSNRNISFNGERLTLAEWSKRLGMSYGSLQYRLNNGWTIIEAFTTPIRSS